MANSIIKWVFSLFGPVQKKTAAPTQKKKATGRPLDDLAMISGLTKNEVRNHVKLCGIKYQDALKYYLYFNRMPDPQYSIVIRHYGVENLIHTVKNQIKSNT